ncbi:cytochrome c3 family protein [Thermodesulfobacteriota bacterium]
MLIRPGGLLLAVLVQSAVFGLSAPVLADTEGCVSAKCHPNILKAKYVHGPVASEKCTACHLVGPRDAPPEKHDLTLKKTGDYLCIECHNDFMLSAPHEQDFNPQKPQGHRCTLCHHPHKAENRFFLLKDSAGLICLECHAKQTESHPAQADHLTMLPEAIRESRPDFFKNDGGVLPLQEDHLTCLTCHVTHRRPSVKTARIWPAQSKSLLRLSASYELCVACHVDKRVQELLPDTLEELPQPKKLRIEKPVTLSVHEPTQENRCKVCHAITLAQRSKPPGVSLCFQEGCHSQARIMEKEFAHDRAVLENCYMCHMTHTSSNKALLKAELKMICRSCHPHIRNRSDSAMFQPQAPDLQTPEDVSEELEETENTAENSPPDAVGEQYNEALALMVRNYDSHTLFLQYLQTAPVPQEKKCNFCHLAGHGVITYEEDFATCSGCHMFVQKVLVIKSGGPVNLHQTFITKNCARCHDPHSAPYDKVLKLEPTYRFKRIR